MRRLIIPILLLVLSVASIFWYTKPAYSEIGNVSDEIEEYETALSRIGEIQQIRNQLLNRYNQLPEDSLYILNKILPSELDTVRFLIELDQIATVNGLTIQEPNFNSRQNQANRPEEEGPSEPYESTNVTFSISGSYEDITDFTQDIEHSARLMDIVELVVSSESEAEGAPAEAGQPNTPSGEQNTYNFTVKTYWLPEPDPNDNPANSPETETQEEANNESS